MSRNDVAVLRAFDEYKLDKRAQKALETVSDALADLELDKRTRKAAQTINAAIKSAHLDRRVSKAVADAKLDKRAKVAGKLISDNIDDLQLQKRLAALNEAIADLRLDRRTRRIADAIQRNTKNLKLDAKVAAVAASAADTVASWKLDKKAGDLADSVADLKLDKKAGNLADTVAGWRLDKKAADAAGTVADLKLDKKAGKLMDSAANVKLDKKAKNVADSISDLKLDKKASNLADTVSDLKLDKRAGDAAETLSEIAATVSKVVVDAIKDFELDKRASDVAGSVADLHLDKRASDVMDTVSSKVKDLELDKRAANVVDTVADWKLDKRAADLVDTVSNRVKDFELDKRASNLADTTVSTVKDWKLGDRASGFADNTVSTVKDWKLGDKAATAAATASSAVQKIDLSKAQDVPGVVGDRVRDLKLDKRASDVAGNVSDRVKALKLDEKAGAAADSVSNLMPGAKLDRTARALAEETGVKPADTLEMAHVRDTLKDLGFQYRFSNLADSFGAGIDTQRYGDRGDAIIKTTQRAIRDADITTDPNDVGKAVLAGLAALGVTKDRKKIAKEAEDAVAKEQDNMRKQYKDYRQNWAEQVKMDLRGIQFSEPKTIKDDTSGGFPWKTLLLLSAVTGGLAANNTRIWANVPPLESVLEGPARYHKSRQGVIFYKNAGTGDKTPIVMVHGIGAGATSYEWRRNFSQLATDRPVYAYDLLGFGNSERPPFHYTPEVYIKQLTEFLDEVVGKPAIVMASSLSGSYAIQVAYRRPELVERLVLIAPTGINRMAGQPGPNLFFQWLEAILRSPIYGTAMYSGIASRASIESFSRNQMYYDAAQVTPDLIQQYWVAAHQEGAKYGPAAFLSGHLNAEVDQTFAKITQPTLLVWGRNSTITPLKEGEALKAANPRARLEVIDNAKLVPNDEHAEQFNTLVRNFVQEAIPTQPSPSTANVGFVRKGLASETSGNTFTSAADGGTKESTLSPVTSRTSTGSTESVATPVISNSAEESAQSPQSGNASTSKSTFSNPDSNRTENAGAPDNAGVAHHENASPLDERRIDSSSNDPKRTSEATDQVLADHPSLTQPAPSAAEPVALDPSGNFVADDAKNSALTTSSEDIHKFETDKQQHSGAETQDHSGGTQIEAQSNDTALG